MSLLRYRRDSFLAEHDRLIIDVRWKSGRVCGILFRRQQSKMERVTGHLVDGVFSLPKAVFIYGVKA
jgi:hypothetical protein